MTGFRFWLATAFINLAYWATPHRRVYISRIAMQATFEERFSVGQWSDYANKEPYARCK